MKNNKSLGQHWLKDRFILDEIAASAAADVPVCLEIGAGLGTLTSSLLRVFPKVIAVEFDARLAENLPKSFPGKNLEVINEDILKFNLDSIKTPYAVAGNIPYYITSPIITKLLDAKNKPDKIVLLIQKEVADRILAEPGKHTYLSLSVQSKAKVTPGILVTKDYFTPPPKVDSATIILEPFEKPLVTDEILDFIKLGFSSPRKKLIHNLPFEKTKNIEALEKIGLSSDVRPADLTLVNWRDLKNNL